jgi:hypothetical protein
MAHVGISPFSWAGWDNQGTDTQVGEPAYSNQQASYRLWGRNGKRGEYNYDGTAGANAQFGTYAGHNNYTFPVGRLAGLQAAASTAAHPDTNLPIVSTITQQRSGTTVSLTFTAQHVYGVRNAHWTQYASNGTTILAQGECIMTYNFNGGARNTNIDNGYEDCFIQIPNATAGLYCIVDIYSILGQHTSRRVQFA